MLIGPEIGLRGKRRADWSGLEISKEEEGCWAGLRKRSKRLGGKGIFFYFQNLL
jgi:hypothetical protein